LVAVKIAEKALIAQLRVMEAHGRNSAIRTGIGDDCAVLRLPSRRGKDKDHKNQDTLVTTDLSLEGVHFRLDWHPPESVGHRCLARGLSDIAAMGGEPVAAFLSLALPTESRQSWVSRFANGMIRLAERYGITLAGGDTAESPHGIVADIVVIGTAPAGEAVLRSGARPGDLIYVSGYLGGSAVAVVEMRKNPKGRLNPRDYSRHFLPEPRVELGRVLRDKGLVSAMIDTSDGLSTDLGHICEESHVGAKLLAEAIPRARVGKPAKEVDLQLALHGGEDYELLFTSPRRQRIPSNIAGVPITQIGHIIRGRTIFLKERDEIRYALEPQGWEHFRK
jgi:thiamine-monophosphate kinase